MGKEMVLDYIWMGPERVSVGEEGEGHSMVMDRKQKRPGNQQWRVSCQRSGNWENQKRSGEYGRVCKVEDSHRYKTEQCPWYIYSRECLSCTEVGASGETETEVVSFTFFSVRGEQHSWVCDKALDRGSRQARKERTAVVKAWQNEWGDQFHCSLSGNILLDRANSTGLLVAGFGGLTDEVLFGQCAVCCDTI